MKIRLIGINCSARENSNSRQILEIALQNLEKKHPEDVAYKIINLKDHAIEHCKACDECGKSKETGEFISCIIADDAPKIIEEMKATDGFLVATPVYFGLASDLFSKFIMRLRVPRHQDFVLANRVVAILAIAGRRSGGAETTIISSWLPFIRNGCLIVGNGDKTCQFGTMGWAGGEGHIRSDEWGIEQAKDTAERVFQVVRLIKSGIGASGYKNDMKFSYKSGTR